MSPSADHALLITLCLVTPCLVTLCSRSPT